VPRAGLPLHLAPLLATSAIVLGGCGTTTERGSQSFYREHAGEAARVAAATRTLSATVAALPGRPSRTQLEHLAVEEHRARRALLAASKWTVLENGEEENVSQAEREINEATATLLKAMSDIRSYAHGLSPLALAGYRNELALGREYWNQGITQLWFVAHQSQAPRI